MFQALGDGLWTFLTLYDTGVESPQIIREKLQQSEEMVVELTGALSELAYVGIYTPELRIINALSLETCQHFSPLLTTPELLENNKRKLDRLIISPTAESEKRPKKRPCYSSSSSYCTHCHHYKSEKCFPPTPEDSLEWQCYSCRRSGKFQRRSKKKKCK